MIRRISIIIIIFLSLFTPDAKSQNIIQLSDSAQISILTSAPWNATVYTVFGHSAMRVYDPPSGTDLVYNYGTFDFNAPNFTYRFMTGETDYFVVATRFSQYLFEYEMRGIDVYEQVINLKQNEKQRIWDFLIENIKEENRVYRYNIFFDNCTTKLRDILEENIDGTVVYPENHTEQTFRNLLHEHTNKQPWLQFGIDIIIGSNADRKITAREKMFLPIYEYMILTDSYITRQNSSNKELLVNHESAILTAEKELTNDESDFLSPMTVGILLFIITLISIWISYRGKCWLCTIYQSLVLFISGIAGCLVFFMMFFSVHPCTDANWNLVWLNPLLLFGSVLLFAKPSFKSAYYYHFINFVLLMVFILAWTLIPQQFEKAFIPYILSIAIISLGYILKKINYKIK